MPSQSPRSNTFKVCSEIAAIVLVRDAVSPTMLATAKIGLDHDRPRRQAGGRHGRRNEAGCPNGRASYFAQPAGATRPPTRTHPFWRSARRSTAREIGRAAHAVLAACRTEGSILVSAADGVADLASSRFRLGTLGYWDGSGVSQSLSQPPDLLDNRLQMADDLS